MQGACNRRAADRVVHVIGARRVTLEDRKGVDRSDEHTYALKCRDLVSPKKVENIGCPIVNQICYPSHDDRTDHRQSRRNFSRRTSVNRRPVPDGAFLNVGVVADANRFVVAHSYTLE